MIVAKTPLRISFVGGGSDHLTSENSFGSVISVSINKFIYLSIIRTDKDISKISYSKKETFVSFNHINHPIFREVLKYFKINDSGIEITSIADIQGRGSGLGSSGSFTVCLINLISEFKKIKMSKKEIAELAWIIEKEKCRKHCGKQDQYQAAYGGLNQIYFLKNGTVKVNRINIDTIRLKKFKDNLILFDTGIRRNSVNILNRMKNKLIDFSKMHDLLKDFKYELLNGDLDNCGRILDESWQIKKKFTNNISNPLIEKSYDAAIENGAKGGKLLGAGAGGFLLFYCPKMLQRNLIKKLDYLKHVDFNFFTDCTSIKKI
jgi:D-glycero-alpha-D-manno-heptose-7-phosphate kinase